MKRLRGQSSGFFGSKCLHEAFKRTKWSNCKRQTFPTWSFRNIFVIISSALLFGEVYFMTREELREEWERRIADFKDSGMGRVQWCKEHGEGINKLKYWLYKMERQKRHESKK